MDVGSIGWCDLTVSDAEAVKDFYSEVVGWTATAVDMDGYSDFTMGPKGGAVGGICHARGANASVPAHWIMYIVVEDMEKSLKRAVELGGEVVDGPRGGFVIVRDPAGAVFALYQADQQ